MAETPAPRAHDRGERAADALSARRAGLESRHHWDEPSLLPGHNAQPPLVLRHLRTALDTVSVRPGEDVFLDYGCGRGQALLLAARYPFRRVMGVELVPALAREARRRAACAEDLSCPEIVVEQADAADFEVPRDVSVVLLSSPFERATLRRLLTRLRASFEASPRPLRIACLCPIDQDDLLAAAPWLTALGQLPTGLWTDMRLTLYAALHGG